MLTKKEQAIKLRVENKLSIKAINKRLDVPKSTLSYWLKPHPLSKKEMRDRMSKAGKKYGRIPIERGEESSLHKLLDGRTPKSAEKAKIAESAVLLRLFIKGWEVYGSIFEGDKFDWVVNTKEKLVCIQVKIVSETTNGSPGVKLRCSDGRNGNRKYKEGEFDFIVGYDLYTDTAFVWSWQEIKGMSQKSVCPEAAERWDKLIKQ
jgi:transposase-like protein